MQKDRTRFLDQSVHDAQSQSGAYCYEEADSNSITLTTTLLLATKSLESDFLWPSSLTLRLLHQHSIIHVFSQAMYSRKGATARDGDHLVEKKVANTLSFGEIRANILLVKPQSCWSLIKVYHCRKVNITRLVYRVDDLNTNQCPFLKCQYN